MPSADAIRAEDGVIGPLLESALASAEWQRLPAGFSRKSERWRLEILKYRKGRRLCLRAVIPCTRKNAKGETRYILKIWYNRRGQRIFQQLEHMGAQLRQWREPPLILPRPLFYDEPAHTLAYEEIAGEPVTRPLRRGASRDVVLRIAEALAFFHNLAPPPLAGRTPEDEIASVESLLRQPEWPGGLFTRRLKSLIARLRRTVPGNDEVNELLHRDLYDQQILIVPGVACLAFLDLDDMARGDAMLDTGNFLAHLHLMRHWQKRPEKLARLRRRFMRRWSRLRTRPPASLDEKARWYEAVALARLAAMQAQRGNPALAEYLAEQATHLLSIRRGQRAAKSSLRS